MTVASPDDITVGLNDKGREALYLWIHHVPVTEAPKHLREALRMLYRDFDSVRIGIALALQVPTVGCKTPGELRELAIETIRRRKRTH